MNRQSDDLAALIAEAQRLRAVRRGLEQDRLRLLAEIVAVCTEGHHRLQEARRRRQASRSQQVPKPDM